MDTGVGMGPGQVPNVQTRQIPKLMAGVKLSRFMELPEDEFRKLVKEIEEDPLFKRLFYPPRPQEKIIKYSRFPRVELSRQFYELRESVVPSENSFDPESLLSQREEIVSLIRKVGPEKFKQYFLYSGLDMNPKKLAEKCQLSIQEVQKISSFMDEFSIHSEFYFPSTIRSGSKITYHKIASVEKGDQDELIIGCFSPDLARGKYTIDYERLDQLQREEIFNQKEMEKISKLLRSLELINIRKNVICQILQWIVEVQRRYLESGDPQDLKPFSQKELAARIGVNPSLVCRALQNRSIDTPLGHERPLKFFLPSKKEVRKELIGQIWKEERPLSDEQIRIKLKEKFGLSVSRRTVNDCRRELKLS
jgi:hypothetical protein